MNETTMREFAPKASDAIMFMVTGIITQERRQNFEINMGEFLDAGEKRFFPEVFICIGCAATCAVQEATGRWLVPWPVYYNEYMRNIYEVEEIPGMRRRQIIFGLELVNDFYDWECMIDSLRAGNTFQLSRYYDIKSIVPAAEEYLHSVDRVLELPRLSTQYEWNELIPYIKLAQFLKSMGL